VSLFKRGNTWHFAFRWNGRRYRGSCKTSRQAEAKKVEALVLARLLEDGRLPWSRKVPTLTGLSNRFFKWLESLPKDRPPNRQPAGITGWAGESWSPHTSLV
jgi:hypothetical protein